MTTDRVLKDVDYRGHRPGDMGWIVQRHAELYYASHGWDETFEAMVAQIVSDFLSSYDPERERCWIAEAAKERAGSIALVQRSTTEAQLRLLFVEPWARGLGIGKHLVSACVGRAREIGYETVVLHTVRGLDAARGLYQAEGFQLVDERPDRAFGHAIVDQTWRLRL